MTEFPQLFRDPAAARALLARISQREGGRANIMEFCGGHTVAIFRSGIRGLLPARVRLLSGPGCPVCVTSAADLDKAMALAALPRVTLATYGDMMRVPGSHGSLYHAKAGGADVRVVYSPLDALELAARLPDREVVFFAIGFETTAPATAAVLERAAAERRGNFSVCSVMKLTTPGARALLELGELRIDGVIGPGHVSAVIGAAPWRFLPGRHGIPVAVSGFEPLDILQAVDALLEMIDAGAPAVVNCYTRSVQEHGNRKAWSIVERVLEPADAAWRGFGVIPASGLRIRDAYAAWDAERRFAPRVENAEEHPTCRCGDVLRGVLEPPDCPVFGLVCTPEHPLGPCMVSAEGTCAAHYAYRDAAGSARG
jgi:hydrogenase expression/formation protein HypD